MSLQGDIEIGQIRNAKGIRKTAYLYAKKQNIISKTNSFNDTFSLNKIFEKTLFEKNYKEKEKILIRNRFEKENRLNNIQKKTIKTFQNKNINLLTCAYQIIKSLLYIILINVKTPQKQTIKKQNAIICRIDCLETKKMWNVFFPKKGSCLFFYRNQTDIKTYKNRKRKESCYGLTLRQRIFLFYIYFCSLKFFFANHFVCQYQMASVFFPFIRNLIQGTIATPDCKGGWFFTFEHGSAAYAFRNILLERQNVKSIFVPFNAYAIDHFFAPEHKMNYSIVFSSGKLFEEAYLAQQSTAKKILPIGPFLPNWFRKAKRKTKKINLTFLFTGLSKYTKIQEVALARIAAKIIKTNSVKIYCRLKPIKMTRADKQFYINLIPKSKQVEIEHQKKSLFSYLSKTNLFITGNSSSAVDFMCAGGDFLSGNFQNDSDLYSWQTKVPGVFLKPRLLHQSIKKYIKSQKTRQHIAQKMHKLRSYFYLFKSRAKYLKNLNKNLRQITNV